MAIIEYKKRSVSPDVSVSLSEISVYSMQTRAMLSALGDYWTAYFRDLEPVTHAATGSVAAISKEYTKFLDMVLASNVLDIPIANSSQFDLIVIDSVDFVPVLSDDLATVKWYSVAVPELMNVEFLTTALFDSPVVLEKGVHYDVIPGEGYRFYVDIFKDRGIVDYVYSVSSVTSKKILLWACDIALSGTVIYDRYGRFIYRKSVDSEQYRWLITALMRFYENVKSTRMMQDVLDILYGVPYTRYPDEVIQEIYPVDKNLNRTIADEEEPYLCILTDKAKYYTYAFSAPHYAVGEVIPQFSLLASFNKVEDYVTTPGWWEEAAFPEALVSSDTRLTYVEKNNLMDAVLKYNTVHIRIGISYATYRTYLQQRDELFKTIESGIPVYLFPVVDSIFRVAFADNVNMEELIGLMTAYTEFSTTYDWGRTHFLNGRDTYYSHPENTHGGEVEDPSPKSADGVLTYDGENIHDGSVTGDFNCDGVKYYNTGEEINHNNDTESFQITSVGIAQEDRYPWDTAPAYDDYAHPTYGGNNPGWAQVFGPATSVDSNELFRFSGTLHGQEDVFPLPEDPGDICVTLKFNDVSDVKDYLRLSGGSTYGGHTVGTVTADGIITDDGTVIPIDTVFPGGIVTEDGIIVPAGTVIPIGTILPEGIVTSEGIITAYGTIIPIEEVFPGAVVTAAGIVVAEDTLIPIGTIIPEKHIPQGQTYEEDFAITDSKGEFHIGGESFGTDHSYEHVFSGRHAYSGFVTGNSGMSDGGFSFNVIQRS